MTETTTTKPKRQRKPDKASMVRDDVVTPNSLATRLMEKKKELVRQSDVDEIIEGIIGIVLTHLSGMAARCSRDIPA